ncbi:MAG: pyridoxamine 5'-phosphate oxidase family protein [Coriobacteriales bacterium]|jgi:nitroimidazol reductase NimA-like FMN-containing flavoprotein (pyridoxamine 5'-phosphate oxidase superfamily)|nr:pyridoxamine 5'-phosphate oxidase family protein [Coriobacteriales bacterium]
MRGDVRAKNLELDLEQTLDIIRGAEHGVLATVSADGVPAAVALNHVYSDGVLYFHCGHEGEKLDNIRANPQVSFFVVGQADVHYDQFTESYTSAVVNGRIEIVVDEAERLQALRALTYRYASHLIPTQTIEQFTAEKLSTVEILKLTPETITGKARPRRHRPGLEYTPIL